MPMTAQHRNQATDLKMKASDFTVPIEERYFEDYLPGLILEYGTIPITEAEITDFATRFDPQYFHTDPEAAKDGPYGGLIASGWHTAAVMMRLVVDHYLSKVVSLGSVWRATLPLVVLRKSCGPSAQSVVFSTATVGKA